MTVVVNSQQGSASTATAATTQAITPTGIVAGRSLILLIANSGGSTTGVVSGVTDTGGNTWTLPAGGQGGVAGSTNTRLAAAYVHNCVAPGTITATMGSIGGRKLLLLEVTGLQNATVDQAVTDTTGGAAAQTQAVAPNLTTSAACFEIAYHVRNGTSDPTGLTAGWTGTTAGKPDNTTPLLRGAFREFAAAGATGNVIWTYASSQKFTGAALAFKVTAGGTVFTQSISGAASFSGIRPVVAMSRRQPGILSFTGGEVAHPTARSVNGALSFSGIVSNQKSLLRTLTGALSFSGAASSAAARFRSLTGALTFTGAQSRIKSVSKAVSGALSFVGAQTRLPGKALPGVFAPTGVMSENSTLGRTVSGVLAPAGALSRRTSHQLNAAVSWVGMLAANSRGALKASFRPTGTVTHGLPARTFFAALAFSTSLSKRTTRFLFSSLTAAGVMNTQYLPPTAPTPPGGGGFGALMSDEHFRRYRVTGAWKNVKRVKV